MYTISTPISTARPVKASRRANCSPRGASCRASSTKVSASSRTSSATTQYPRRASPAAQTSATTSTKHSQPVAALRVADQRRYRPTKWGRTCQRRSTMPARWAAPERVLEASSAASRKEP